MLISEKQHQANRQNSRHSTGPKTPEGKDAARLNALKYGLRAHDLLLPSEDPAEYQQLWDDLVSDWQPFNRTERLLLEQMATSQWLLARVTRGERLGYEVGLPYPQLLALSRETSVQRARLERSFSSAMQSLMQLQKARKSAANSDPKSETAAIFSEPSGGKTYKMSGSQSLGLRSPHFNDETGPRTLSVSNPAVKQTNPDAAVYL